jgi:hypothetical protein
LKKFILFFSLVIIAVGAKAQAGYNYYELGVGADLSYIRGYTNVPRQDNHPAFNVNFIYNYNPFLPIEAEIQVGQLSGGGLTKNLDLYRRKFDNNYKAILFHADIQLGAVVDFEGSWFLTAAKGFYVGSGFGFIDNSVKTQRYSLDAPAPPDTGAYRFYGKDKSISIMIPFRFGYEFKIYDSYDEPRYAIDLGYVHTFAFGEGLDGYDDPPQKFKNNAIDQYRQFTIGFKYFFGNVVSYNKLVRVYGR